MVMDYNNIIEENFRNTLNIKEAEHKLFIKATDEQLNNLLNLLGSEVTEVIKFYKNNQPYEIPMLDCYLTLCDIDGIIEESTSGEPGRYLSNYNVFVFAVTVGGNVVCIDTNDMHNGDPSVLLISSDFCMYNYNTDVVEITDFPDEIGSEDDTLVLNYENIVKCVYKLEDSFTLFMEKLSRNEYEDIEEFL